MYKRILVPTDLSQPSRQALLTALQLAKQFNSEVELFHVAYTPLTHTGLEGPSYNMAVYPDIKQVERDGELILEAVLKGVDVGNVPLQKKLTVGYPASAIIDEANGNFDLIVMGCRGQGPIAGAFLGSVTQRVLAHAQCPVLVVK